ncbi:RNA-binding protein 34 isoform X2 [Homo sapiens]|uniref:RNA-binding protein 34 isoform X2 n=1 Tax=Homo sapiens TaxID=9606 RepID=UPI001FB05F19|nr:RNA-binding protein 34 isoform X2 [Homo sapiens]XP_054191232.1 RNA-binding protein 34 isoform X2 [Homo sapiens]
MALEGMSKRKRKRSVQEGENPDDGVRGSPPEDYRLGQVASSLFRGEHHSRGGTGRLASLFSSLEPQIQPVYVPVPKQTIKKTKRNEEEESTSQIERPLSQEPAKKVKAKKKHTNAEKKLADRESALASADLEEEIHQKQGQKRKNSQPGVKVADRKILDDTEDTVVSQRKKIQINQEEERLKNERTVFVGNLPVTCNKKIPAEGTLSKKLAAIKRKIHPDQKNINAYVVFKEESAATQALKRNGAQIADGFRIRVDLASETSSRDKRSVFVGNLPYIEESAIEKHFLDCGSIMAVRIVRDKMTGIGKGFGYVLFENTDSVHLALKLNNSELMGRKLRVMRSVNKEKFKQQNSNPRLKNVSKPKQGLNFTSKTAEGHPKSLFIGEKAVLLKTKKKGQKKSGRPKKQRKQK